jgi:hypothetical protein
MWLRLARHSVSWPASGRARVLEGRSENLTHSHGIAAFKDSSDESSGYE